MRRWPMHSTSPSIRYDQIEPAIEARIDELLGQLTLEEKVGQTIQTNPRTPDLETEIRSGRRVVAGPKHYVAYGAAEAVRDYNTVDLSDRSLREVYLPPFKAALDAGAGTVMSAFNDINGVPATANSFILRTVLRQEWGFS